MNCNWHEGLVNQFAETIHSPSLLFQATKTSLGTTPHLITVTFWTFELVAGETGGAFHQPQREENTTT